MARVFLAAATFLFAIMSAEAADLTWGAAGEGGSGTWDVTTNNWYNGVSATKWPAAGGSAIFAGTAGTVTLGSSSIIYADNLTFNTPGYVIAGSRSLYYRGGENFTIAANADATITASLSLSGGVLRKIGPATLNLKTFTGVREVDLESGTLRSENDTGLSGSARYVFSKTSPVALLLGGTPAGIFFAGSLEGGGAAAEIRPAESADGERTLWLNEKAATFAGSLRDYGTNKLALTLSNSAVQELTGANSYSGPTGVHATLILSGSGTAPSTAMQVSHYGTLILDNSQRVLPDRLSDGADFSLAGRFRFLGNRSDETSESIGPIIPGFGAGVVEVRPDSAHATTLRFAALQGAATGTAGPLVFLAPGMGETASAGAARIIFKTAPTLVGGAGARGTPEVSIVPGVFGGATSVSGFLTHEADGLRPLGDSEYIRNSLEGGAGRNASIDHATILAVPGVVNALRLRDGGSVTGTGGLTVSSGMIFADSGTSSLSPASLALGSNEATVYAAGVVEIASPITADTLALRKSGPGRLILSGSSPDFAGPLTVNQGVLQVANPAALGTASGTADGITVQIGSVELAGDVAIGMESLFIQGTGERKRGGLRSVSGNNTWAGPIKVQAGSIGVDSGTLTLLSPVNGELAKAGPGKLVLPYINSIIGTTIDEGTMVVTATANPAPGALVPGPVGPTTNIRAGTLSFAPSGSGQDVQLTLGTGAAGTAGRQNAYIKFTFAAHLALDRGANDSLTLAVGRYDAFFASFYSDNGSSLAIKTASGSLGTGENIVSQGGVPFENGIITPSIVFERNDSQRSADYLSYSADGFVRATPAATADLQQANSQTLFAANSPQTLSADASVRALIDNGQTLDLAGHRLDFGSPSYTAGLILNGGTITGGLLRAEGRKMSIYTSLANASISSQIYLTDADADLIFSGPGTLTLTGSTISHHTTVNEGTLKLFAPLQGDVRISPGAVLAGAGKISGNVEGGRISPGDGPGVLTAGSVHALGTDLLIPQTRVSFSFEFTKLGMPVFGNAQASGNDLLRLTDASAGFDTALTDENDIDIFFRRPQGLQLGDTFLGGFYVDAGEFLGSIQDANFHFYLSDPAGEVQFGGESFSLYTEHELQISTVLAAADFGSGTVGGYIMQLQVVIPEPADGALLGLGACLVAGLRPRRGRGSATI